MNYRATLITLAMSTLAISAVAQAPVLAATPPMGWNSWNHFEAKIEDATVRAQADAIVANGMKDAGYVYINIDDTWQGKRDAQGNIGTNSRFPDMRALADYVHSKGLKLGIYSSPGNKTCAKNAARERMYDGSLGHEEQDAKLYASWGVDFLKYDLCGLRDPMKAAATPEAARIMMVTAYAKMRDALRATGRPIVYSLCQYGYSSVWKWGPEVGGNMWRTTEDINDTYSRMAEIGFSQAGLSRFAGPGHWNDPDMLEVGNGGMNLEEYRTHMSLWAILAAPLLAGNDLSKMSPATLALLTNRDVIAIDQDAAGIQGDRLSAEGPIEVWVKPMADGSKAVGIFNRLSTPLPAEFDLRKLALKGKLQARDLWTGQMVDTSAPLLKASLPGHGVMLLRVSGKA